MISNKKRKAVISNDLIGSNWELDINEMRVLLYALSQVDSVYHNPGEVVIYPKEFAFHMNVQEKNVHRTLASAVKKVSEKELKILQQDLKVPIFEYIRYEKIDGEAQVSLKFSKDIEVYLFNLSANYTRIYIADLCRLNTVVQIRMYLLLKKHEFNLAFKRSVDVIFTLEELKALLNINGTYKLWSDFKKGVISPVIDKINNVTNLEVEFCSFSNSRKVSGVHFKLKKVLGKSVRKPRLQKRPHCFPGSQLEFDWAKSNLGLLQKYHLEILDLGPERKIDSEEIKKCIRYAKITNNLESKKLYEELLQHGKPLKDGVYSDS